MTESQTVEETRPFRMCDECGQVDDHPRHVFALTQGSGVTTPEIGAKALAAAGQEHFQEVLAQVMDTATVMRHMDCCRAAGCPGGSCNVVTAGAENLKGSELVDHLVSRGPLDPTQAIQEGQLVDVEGVVQGEVVDSTTTQENS